MTRQKSELLKAMGTGFEIFKGVTDEVLALGGGDDDLRRINKDETLRRKIAELIVGKADGSTYPVTVDYDFSVAAMIRKGKYDYANTDITAEHFPLTGEGEVNVAIELMHFNKVMTSDEVFKELDKRGLRAATLPELLAFGAMYPDVQRQFPVVALGSVWQFRFGNRYVPCLWGGAGGRCLCLLWLADLWLAYYRFASVRK